MKTKRNFIFLGLAFSIANSSISYAMPIYSIYSYAFNNSDRFILSKDFREYLVLNGLTKSEISELNSLFDKYTDSLEELWEEIELGYILFDEIIFRDSEIENEYNKALNKYGYQKDAYLYIKRSLVNNPELVTNKIKKILKDANKVSKAFNKKYGRNPTHKELEYLSDIKTMKYASYGGFLGSELTDEQRELVDNGQGYVLLGLNADLIEQYLEFIELRGKLENLELKYLKSVIVFEGIWDSILRQSNVDILKELSYEERLEIYAKSIEGLFFNDNKAFKLVVNKLKGRFPGIEKIEYLNDTVYPNLDNENPYNDMSNSTSKDRINKILTQMFNSIYNVVPTDINKKPEYIFFKYKNLDIDSGVTVDELGFISNTKLERLIKKLESILGASIVLGEKEIMMFLDNKIQVVDCRVTDSNEIAFEYIQTLFKPFGIEVYKKERVDKTSPDKIKEEVKKYLIIENKNKVVSVELGEEEKIGLEKTKEILSKIDTKIVFFENSFIALREGNVYTPKELKTISYNLDFNQLQELFKDIGLPMSSIRLELK